MWISRRRRSVGLPSILNSQVAALFAAGEQGAWYDPSDFSTLFQDAAGTVPVTAVGQPVGRMLDKSGRGNHLVQATAASRPVLQSSGGLHYLLFDGVDDGMATAGAVNFTATDKATVWVGVRKESDAATGLVVELGASVLTTDGSFAILAPNGATATFGMATRGTAATTSPVGVSTFAAPMTAVLQASFDNGAAPNAARRVNGVAQSPGNGTSAGNFGNHLIYIGRRTGTSSPLNGRFFGCIVRGAASSAAQITSGEQWCALKSGVTLP